MAIKGAQQGRSSGHSCDSKSRAFHGFPHRDFSPLDMALLGIGLARCHRSLLQRHLNHFCKMQSVTIGALRDLLTAAEPIGDDQAIGRRPAYRRQEFEFADRH